MSCDGYTQGRFDEHGHYHEDHNWIGIMFLFAIAGGVLLGLLVTLIQWAFKGFAG